MNLNYKIVIQARTSSTRLKNKLFLKINDLSIFEIMIKRLKKHFNNKLIICIGNKNPKKLKLFCEKHKIPYFIGSEKNLVNRYLKCAEKFAIKNIIRIPSDCPLIDPKIIKKGLAIYKQKKYDYVSNLTPPSYIDGMDVEIFSFQMLKKLNKIKLDKFDQEHVTTYIRKNKKKFKTKNFGTSKNFSKLLRLTIDYKNDFLLISNIVKHLGIYASYKNIQKYLLKNKNISLLNKKHIKEMWYHDKKFF